MSSHGEIEGDEELFGEHSAGVADHVLPQAEVELLLESIGNFRDGSDEAEEDAEESFFAFMRELEKDDRTAELESFGL